MPIPVERLFAGRPLEVAAPAYDASQPNTAQLEGVKLVRQATERQFARTRAAEDELTEAEVAKASALGNLWGSLGQAGIKLVGLAREVREREAEAEREAQATFKLRTYQNTIERYPEQGSGPLTGAGYVDGWDGFEREAARTALAGIEDERLYRRVIGGLAPLRIRGRIAAETEGARRAGAFHEAELTRNLTFAAFKAARGDAATATEQLQAGYDHIETARAHGVIDAPTALRRAVAFRGATGVEVARDWLARDPDRFRAGLIAGAFAGVYDPDHVPGLIAAADGAIAARTRRAAADQAQAGRHGVASLALAITEGAAGAAEIERAHDGGKGWLGQSDYARLKPVAEALADHERSTLERVAAADRMLQAISPDPSVPETRAALEAHADYMLARIEPDREAGPRMADLVEGYGGYLPSGVVQAIANGLDAASGAARAQATAWFAAVAKVAPGLLDRLTPERAAFAALAVQGASRGLDPAGAAAFADERLGADDAERERRAGSLERAGGHKAANDAYLDDLVDRWAALPDGHPSRIAAFAKLLPDKSEWRDADRADLVRKRPDITADKRSAFDDAYGRWFVETGDTAAARDLALLEVVKTEGADKQTRDPGGAARAAEDAGDGGADIDNDTDEDASEPPEADVDGEDEGNEPSVGPGEDEDVADHATGKESPQPIEVAQAGSTSKSTKKTKAQKGTIKISTDEVRAKIRSLSTQPEMETIRNEIGFDEDDLLALMWAESAADKIGDFNEVFTDSVSRDGAYGMAQMQLKTAQAVWKHVLGETRKLTVGDLRKPETALRLAAGLMKDNAETFQQSLKNKKLTTDDIAAVQAGDGKKRLLVAVYNSTPKTIAKAVALAKANGNILNWEQKLPQVQRVDEHGRTETQNHLEKYDAAKRHFQ